MQPSAFGEYDDKCQSQPGVGLTDQDFSLVPLPGIGFMWWTGETGRMEWHSYCAYGLICLVISRIVWGFIGSYHARFTHFLVGPKRIIQHIREPGEVIGHNPLGALSTIALLSLLLAQGLSGLFSVDDASFEGPLAYVSDGDFIDIATEWHEVLEFVAGIDCFASVCHCFLSVQASPAPYSADVVWLI